VAACYGTAATIATTATWLSLDGTFDALPISVTNALGQQTSTGYSALTDPTGGFGLWPTSTTDANNQTTTFSYDALRRMLTRTLPGETSGLNTVSWSYTDWCSGTAAQTPCVEIDETQRLDPSTTIVARSFYDSGGHLVETRRTGPGGEDIVSYAEYDASARLVFESNSYMVTAYTGDPGAAAYAIPDTAVAGTSTSYDGIGRVTSVTDPLANTTTTGYTLVCNPPGTGDSACYEQTLVTDPLGHQRATLTDAFGREDYDQRYTGSSPSTYQLYATTRYTYDYSGDLTQILQPDETTRTTFQYDLAGRKTGMTDPDRGTESYSYDPDANLIESVDARGSAGTVYAGYDGLDRQIWRNSINSPTNAQVTFSYDSTANGNDGVGRLTSETFSGAPYNILSGSESFVYDVHGQQISQTLTMGGVNYTTSKTYDDAGNVLTQTYPDGETVTTSYSQGWLSGLSTTQGNTTLLNNVSYIR
jgi:YD repeat-containing protein